MDKTRKYALYLLIIAGCGGLLFDFGGTIIGPALPYIGPVEDNPGSLGLFNTSEISHLSSAVVMCAAIACLAAGWLTEKLGRKLMMLVSAFATREQIMAAYKEAIEQRYRMLSFGDAMLIL